MSEQISTPKQTTKHMVEQIISAVSNEYRNSDLRADNPEIRRRLREAFDAIAKRALNAEHERDELVRLAPHQSHCEVINIAGTPEDSCTCWKSAYRAAVLREQERKP